LTDPTYGLGEQNYDNVLQQIGEVVRLGKTKIKSEKRLHKQGEGIGELNETLAKQTLLLKLQEKSLPLPLNKKLPNKLYY
jgi:hypothetical protein